MKIKERFYIYFNSTGSKEDQYELFDYIWENYSSTIKIIINRLATQYSNEDKEDLFQETFIKIFNSIDSYNPVFSFNTWLNSIIKNHLIDEYKRKRIHTTNIDNLILKGDAIEESLINKIECEQLKEIISSLTPDKSQLMNLKFIQNLSNSEIANKLKIKEVTTRVRISRIKKEIAEIYRSKYGQEF